jgi:hemerythrin-like domain-containing protein
MGRDRRQFLASAAALGMTLPVFAQDKDHKAGDQKDKPEEVGATEDLLREHGLLNRVLLVDEEGLRRLGAKEAVAPEVFHKMATRVRKFVEDYHEKLEETFIFPEFEKHKKLVDLVRTLRRQHAAGRAVTDVILRTATGDRFAKSDARQELARACAAFVRMYRPHEAREDTVLFPALRKIVPAKRLGELGEPWTRSRPSRSSSASTTSTSSPRRSRARNGPAGRGVPR